MAEVTCRTSLIYSVSVDCEASINSPTGPPDSGADVNHVYHFDRVLMVFDYLRIDGWFVSEGDRVLKDGGFLIIHDFAETTQPFARPYEHREGILSYHLDFAKLWLAHPLYHMVQRRIYETGDMVTVLKKGAVDSIEVRP